MQMFSRDIIAATKKTYSNDVSFVQQKKNIKNPGYMCQRRNVAFRIVSCFRLYYKGKEFKYK